jgi:Zn-dependent metalloprotease
MLVSTIFASLLVSVNAAPAPSLHTLELVKRNDAALPFVYPESVVETNNLAQNASFGSVVLSSTQTASLATSSLAKALNIDESELKLISQFTDAAGVSHVYVDRLINNVPVANQNAAVHIKNGAVTSYSSSFHAKANNLRPVEVKKPEVIVSLEDAVKTAQAKLGAPKVQPFITLG